MYDLLMLSISLTMIKIDRNMSGVLMICV